MLSDESRIMPAVGQAIQIAVDGPVASGKSSIGRFLAGALGFLYLDTGAMYRGVAALVLERGISPSDEQAVGDLASTVKLDFPNLASSDAVHPPLFADGADITDLLRLPAVEAAVSTVAGYPRVRKAMVLLQRAIAESRSAVMVGRDIGTVVLPEAAVKLYLTASVEERARRRTEEREASGLGDSFEATLQALRLRDKLDSERPISPLRPADDAVLLDTTGFSLNQAAEAALALVRNRLGERFPA
jgi:cytidylate kinase